MPHAPQPRAEANGWSVLPAPETPRAAFFPAAPAPAAVAVLVLLLLPWGEGGGDVGTKQTRAQNRQGEGGPDDERKKKTTVRLLVLYCCTDAREY